MPTYFIYFIYTGILALMLAIVVPREEIRRLAIAGIVYGGAFNAIIIWLIGLLNVAEYQQY